MDVKYIAKQLLIEWGKQCKALFKLDELGINLDQYNLFTEYNNKAALMLLGIPEDTTVSKGLDDPDVYCTDLWYEITYDYFVEGKLDISINEVIEILVNQDSKRAYQLLGYNDE